MQAIGEAAGEAAAEEEEEAAEEEAAEEEATQPASLTDWRSLKQARRAPADAPLCLENYQSCKSLLFAGSKCPS